MNKAKKTLATMSIVIAFAAIGGAIVFDNTSERSYKALDVVNEYGCRDNCTAEYQIDHAYRILDGRPTNYRIDGVRFKVKYSYYVQGMRWFKDINDPVSIACSADIKANLGSVIAVIGRETGLEGPREGQEASFFGSILWQWDPWGKRKIIYVENPTFYKVGDQEDLSLLQSPVYME